MRFPLGAGHHDTVLKLVVASDIAKKTTRGKRMATLTNVSGLIIGKSTMITLYWHNFEPCQSDLRNYYKSKKLLSTGASAETSAPVDAH